MRRSKNVRSSWDKMRKNMNFFDAIMTSNQLPVCSCISFSVWSETYKNIEVWSNVTSNLCTVSIVVFVVMNVILVAIEVIVQIVQNPWIRCVKRWENGHSEVQNTVKVDIWKGEQNLYKARRAEEMDRTTVSKELFEC